MKPQLFVFLLLGSVLAVKEFPEEISSIFSEKIIHELEKRLKDYDSNNDRSEYKETDPQCTFDIEENTIIKTKLSIDDGAIFIDSPTIDEDVINPRLNCKQKCCETEKCDLAVFKEKDEHACYLFNCGEPNKCSFGKHDGFSSIGLIGGVKHSQMVTANKNQHAEDLAELAAKVPTTTTISTTTTTTKAPKKDPVPLFGTCNNDKECAGSGTECLASYCVCADGYHPQDGICRESCTRFQFECKNDGQPLMYPQCVAIYDACDGIDHCKDGSDEQNCPPGTKGFKGRNGNIPDSDNREAGQSLNQDGNKDEDVAEPKENPDQKDGVASLKNTQISEESMNRQVQHQQTSTPVATSTKAMPSKENVSEEQPSSGLSSQGSGAQQDSAEKPKGTPDIHHNASDVGESKLTNNPSNDNLGSDENKKKQDISVAKVEVADNDANILIEEAAIEETIENSRTSNRTAVIVLALGLGITAILLMFVGCRLRNVKRRLRRGRPMNSNEADYLINGMYL